jgi:hypothetical protein
MVTRKWLRSALTALLLYTVAGAVIAYFGLNAYSGNRGLRYPPGVGRLAELSGM